MNVTQRRCKPGSKVLPLRDKGGDTQPDVAKLKRSLTRRPGGVYKDRVSNPETLLNKQERQSPHSLQVIVDVGGATVRVIPPTEPVAAKANSEAWIGFFTEAKRLAQLAAERRTKRLECTQV